MKLVRVHAYEVKPQRLAALATPPRGGSVAADNDFNKMLNDYLEKSKLKSQPTVNLRRHADGNGAAPTHTLRDQILTYCFGAAPAAKGAAVAIARKLGKSMDERSDSTLLMLAAYQQDPLMRIVMWAFPKEEPLHFSTSGKQARVKILKDAFSRRSSFKKGALLEGLNTPPSFWSAHVIDRQAESGTGTAADYWVSLFLDGVPSLSGKAGTRLLARSLRQTHDALADQDDKDQLTNAIVAIRASTKKQWSLQRFANDFLTDNTKKEFIERTPPESRAAVFTLNKDEFAEKLNFRVFRTQDNVMVAAPFGTIGKSLKIQDTVSERKIKYEGVVVSEKVRPQNAG